MLVRQENKNFLFVGAKVQLLGKKAHTNMKGVLGRCEKVFLAVNTGSASV